MNETQTILVISLVTSHILGDFVFQPDWIAKKKTHFWVQVVHASILATLSYLICGDWTNWLIPVLVFVPHLGIDYAKIQFRAFLAGSKKKEFEKKPRRKSNTNDANRHTDPAWLFISDQLIHFLILTVLAIWVLPPYSISFFWVSLWGKPFLGILILLAGFVVTVVVNGFIVEFIMVPFQLKRERNTGYPNGGKVIGLLERTIIFLLLLIGEPAGIGFLIAAKTIFRLGEIQKANNRKEAEYIIIGTLLSFALGIFVTGLALLLSQDVGGIQYKLFN